MSLFLFYIPSLVQALKFSSIYEFILVLYAQLQYQLYNIAQYTSLVLFYIHSYCPSFKMQLNIRVQYTAICLTLALALKSISIYEFIHVLQTQLSPSFKNQLKYEFSPVHYAQIQPQLQNLAQYTSLVLFYIHSYSPSFKMLLNIRVQYCVISLALDLALKSNSIYESSLVPNAQIQLQH